jgi:hypothetical protein
MEFFVSIEIGIEAILLLFFAIFSMVFLYSSCKQSVVILSVLKGGIVAL